MNPPMSSASIRTESKGRAATAAVTAESQLTMNPFRLMAHTPVASFLSMPVDKVASGVLTMLLTPTADETEVASLIADEQWGVMIQFHVGWPTVEMATIWLSMPNP